jgi:heme/copper-type cytochrome/quinol oxidase subunit 2
MQSLRDILLCILVFFVASIFSNIFAGVVIAVLLYFVLRYRKRLAQLEKAPT